MSDPVRTMSSIRQVVHPTFNRPNVNLHGPKARVLYMEIAGINPFVRTRCHHSPGPHHCIEKVLPSLHPSGRFSNTSGRLSVLDQFQISFQVPRKGRSINSPDDVVSYPDACLLKARIVIQISSFGRQSALVRTRVQLIWKLLIRLQPPGRLPLMVRTRALQICKLRVEELPSGRSSPMVRTREALYGNYLQQTCNGLDVSVSPSGRCS
jgi:hypothetical protein